MKTRILAVLLAVALAGCAVRSPAPVEDRAPQPPQPAAASTPAPPPPPEAKPLPTHTVKRGETLVGIALQYGLDYRELAAWNNIVNPNVLSVDQVLVVAAPANARPVPGPVTTPLATPGPPIEARPLANTPNAKVEPRGQKVPYSDRALAQLNAEAGPRPPRRRRARHLRSNRAQLRRSRRLPGLLPRRPRASIPRRAGPIGRTWTGRGP